MTRKERQEAAIEMLESLGWSLQYAYSPDGTGKRFVFADPGGTTVVVKGTNSLELAATVAYGQAKEWK